MPFIRIINRPAEGFKKKGTNDQWIPVGQKFADLMRQAGDDFVALLGGTAINRLNREHNAG